MTIHSEWARIFYNECPSAFHGELKPAILRDIAVGVIDGHLQLMCLNDKMITWQKFIQYMFLNPIEQMFNMGCKTVVLCFDAYDFVPQYKNMTQLKRSHGKTICTFDSKQELPAKIPEDPMKYLMNRNFKVKLIQMICERIPQVVRVRPQCQFIIDYKKVVMYHTPTSGNIVPVHMPEFESMGESDVKFTRYVEKYGNALVHAIDGDYMIIALLYYANRGLLQNNKIFLYRQTQKDCIPESSITKKRSFEDFQQPRHLIKKNKCWLDMQLVYTALLDAFRQSIRTDRINLSSGLESEECIFIKCVVFVILCAGTDFSRQLPLIGPMRLWEQLPLFSDYLLHGLQNNQHSLIMCSFSKLYKNVFSKHIHCASYDWSRIYANLNSSSLASSTKNKFPTEQQLDTTAKNILWVMHYWSTVNDNVATPMDGSNGYVVCSATRKVQFVDLMS